MLTFTHKTRVNAYPLSLNTEEVTNKVEIMSPSFESMVAQSEESPPVTHTHQAEVLGSFLSKSTKP